ncbi:MAG: hybrid sensor histidine kinase/response regulator, partial [Rikenellaceae bacterium]
MNNNVELEIIPQDHKILLVDDVMSNILLLKGQLKNECYQIVTATNGIEALEVVKKEMPDLILLDVMMPGMSGFEVSVELKKSNEYKHIPIIFLTALNSTSDIVKGFQLGANDFITKPFNKDELIIRVRHQISLIVARRIIIKQTEELRRTILGRDKLYSVIAHDLRGPIGSVKMVLNMLMLNLPASQIGEEMYEMMNLANKTTEDVFSLLDNLLKWTKSQVGRMMIAKQNFDVVGVVKDGISIMETSAHLKGIKLVFDNIPAGEIGVYVDTDLLKTVLRNLIGNAIKFTHEDGEIVVSIEDGVEFVTISVADNGCGMSEEFKAKLFNPEEHSSTFGTNNEEGSG